MSKQGPILIVDDDPDDHQFLKESFKDIGVSNPVLFFFRCEEALAYLETTSEKPFLILSDVNLPEMNGITFKQKIDSDTYLRRKSIPFIYFSTSNNKKAVTEAFTTTNTQGYFQKKATYEELKKVLQAVIQYWMLCESPSSA